MLTTNQISWIAGLLEGEGSFLLTNEGTSPKITLSMTDLDVVTSARDIIFPGKTINIRSDKRKISYKDIYSFSVHGDLAIQWLMTIYCLMGIRRKQRIRELINVWKKYASVKHQQRSQKSASLWGFANRLNHLNLSKSDVKMAKLMKRAGIPENEIMLKLKELKTI